MRLIDADKLRKDIQFVLDTLGEPTKYGLRQAMSIIDKTPTVDAEPIRHGHWIPVNPDVYGAEYFECSVCGMYSRDGLFRKELDYEYCPYCGAKMDEVEEWN